MRAGLERRCYPLPTRSTGSSPSHPVRVTAELQDLIKAEEAGLEGYKQALPRRFRSLRPPPPRLPGSSSASRCQPGRPSVWAAQSACPRLPESQKLLDTDGDYGKTPVPAFLSWVGSRFSHAGLAAMRAPTPTFSRATFLPATRLLTKTPPSCPIRGGIRIYEGSSGESEMTNTSRCSLAMRSVWGSSQVTASACRVRSADRRMRRGSDESHWSFSSGRG